MVFAAGHILTADDLNAMFPVGTGAWTAYTPTWTATTTNPVLGNGTLVGAYFKVGRRVDWRISLTCGSTTTFGTGIYIFSLPPFLMAAISPPTGWATVFDSSAAARFNRVALPNSTSNVVIQSEAGAFVTNLVPMTWANGDSFAAQGFYESTT